MLHNNSVTYNGPNSEAARNSNSLFQFAKTEIDENFDDFEELEMQLISAQQASKGIKKTKKQLAEAEEKMKQIMSRRKERQAAVEARKTESAMQAAVEHAALQQAQVATTAVDAGAGGEGAPANNLFTLDDSSDDDDDDE